MKTAMGLLVSVLGGVLIYDGFKGRSLWSDILSVLRGNGLPTTPTINANGGVGNVPYGPNPVSPIINANGGVGGVPYGPPYSTTQGPTAPANNPSTQTPVNTYSPIPGIGNILGLQ